MTCRTTAGVTYLPIPYGSSNLAGLFTVELPAGVTIGQEFKLRVRRLASRRVPWRGGTGVEYRERINAGLATMRAGGEKGVPMLNWRYVTGTFGVTVPVVDDPTEHRAAARRGARGARLDHAPALAGEEVVQVEPLAGLRVLDLPDPEP